MNNKRIIVKLTRKQLLEAQDDAFEYITSSDSTPFNGYSEVAAGGKLSGNVDADPITTDKVASMKTNQYDRSTVLTRSIYHKNMSESDADENSDGIDDFYNNKTVSALSNGNPNDNTAVVPNTVDYYLDEFLNRIKDLSPIQQSAVLMKILSSVNLKGLSFNIKKELIKRLSLSSK